MEGTKDPSAWVIYMRLYLNLIAWLGIASVMGCTEDSPWVNEQSNATSLLKQAHVRDIAIALNDMYVHFENRNYDASSALCNYVLSREPEYTVALEFSEDLKLIREDVEAYEFVMDKIRNWRKLTHSGNVASIPYADTLAYSQLTASTAAPTTPR